MKLMGLVGGPLLVGGLGPEAPGPSPLNPALRLLLKRQFAVVPHSTAPFLDWTDVDC